MQLSESKLLLVLTIQSGLVKTLVIEIDSSIAASEMEDTRRIVNERLFGLTIGEIRDSVGERLRSAYKGSPKLLRIISDSSSPLFQVSSKEDLHLGGTGNFFLQPEISADHDRMAGLIDLLEERDSILDLLGSRLDHEGIAITIGNEHTSPELQSCSLLTSPYRVGNVFGLIGIIGPTRIPYAKMVPLVSYMAGLTEEMLDH